MCVGMYVLETERQLKGKRSQTVCVCVNVCMCAPLYPYNSRESKFVCQMCAFGYSPSIIIDFEANKYTPPEHACV